MKTFAQTIDLVNDPQIIEKYEEYHRNVWPEVIESLKSIGINRMEIFRSANHLFMYCQAKDEFNPETDFQKYTINRPGTVFLSKQDCLYPLDPKRCIVFHFDEVDYF